MRGGRGVEGRRDGGVGVLCFRSSYFGGGCSESESNEIP